LVACSIAGQRLQAILLGAFGALGLALACIGVNGVTSYSVARRMREMGIRIALGTAPNAFRGPVLRESMALAAAGVAVGVSAALALTRYLSTLLYTVKTTGPAVFTAVSLLVPLRRTTLSIP
jgi:ABC-type antimicrobial peptide transport system permease subunit